MKSDIFYWVLNMSLHGGLLCLIVLLLRRIKALPKSLVYALWSLPFLRLTLCFGVDSPLSIMRLLEKLGTRRVPQSAFSDQPILASANRTYGSAMNSICLAESYDPVTYESNVLTGTMETLALIWMIVACACVLTACLLYVLALRELRGAEKQDGYYLTDRIFFPALYGIFRPRILLPRGISEAALPHILLHERIHRKRGDNFWRCLAIMTCCIHWFNPICWFSLKYFFEDMELSCDAFAIRNMDEPSKKAYVLALLEAVRPKTLFVSAFGGAKLRLRVESILAYRKLTLAASIAFAALFALIALVLVTN